MTSTKETTMDSQELAEYIADGDGGDTYYQLLILDFDTDRPAWWACNQCGTEVDPNQGCTTHAPTDIPGLARAECDNEPPHAPVWTLDGEHNGYGNPCPQCMYNAVAADLAKARKTDRCYHWPWRRWAVTRWAARTSYSLGLASGGSVAYGGGHNGCRQIYLRGGRPYILGVSRETWRCWLKGRHRRGEEVGLGFCGKCVPWPCCGSQTVEHAAGCREADPVAVA
jgi:hypothetical protein